MTDTTVLDPRRLFFCDPHSGRVALLNFQGAKEEEKEEPPKPKHQDLEQLAVAREYINAHLSGHLGYLVVERATNGNFYWVAKIQGTTRWQSETFKLTSGTFREGNRLPFKNPPSQ